MALQVTDSAVSRIQELVQDAKATRPVVHVTWVPHGGDNVRGPNGETIWTRLPGDHWDVFVLDYGDPDLETVVRDFPTIKVRGLEFLHPVIGAYGHVIDEPVVDYESDAFIVRTH